MHFGETYFHSQTPQNQKSSSVYMPKTAQQLYKQTRYLHKMKTFNSDNEIQKQEVLDCIQKAKESTEQNIKEINYQCPNCLNLKQQLYQANEKLQELYNKDKQKANEIEEQKVQIDLERIQVQKLQDILHESQQLLQKYKEKNAVLKQLYIETAQSFI